MGHTGAGQPARKLRTWRASPEGKIFRRRREVSDDCPARIGQRRQLGCTCQSRLASIGPRRSVLIGANQASHHPQSGFAPENLTALAHLAVSSSMNLSNSADELANAAAPRLSSRAII